MNKKRFIRKALRPKMLLIYILLVAIVVLVLTYAFGGIKHVAAETDNIKFVFDENEWINMMEKDPATMDNSKWLAQNDKFVLYFDEATTIATLYTIEDDAKTGSNVTHNGVSYPEIDITKCKVSYKTAQDSANNSNLVVYCADSETGKMYGSGYKSYANSVQYFNKFTQQSEAHYYLNYVDNGVQILYEIGEFNAGENYLPKYTAMTYYKPEQEAYVNKSTGEVDEEKYQAALNNWADYMALLGVEDAKTASYKEWMNALSVTFDERFRGNTILYTKKNTNGELDFTGNIDVYTKEAYEFLKELVDNGDVDNNGNEITYDENCSTDSYTKNAYWKFKNISPDWLAGDGMKYFNTNDTPLTHNYYLSDKVFEYLTKSAYQVSQNTDPSDPDAIDFFDFPYYLRSNNMKGVLLSYSYNLLYTESESTIGLYKEKAGNLSGGYISRNEDGTFKAEGENIERTLYTLEEAAIDNQRFNVTSETSLPIMQICLQIVLNDEGMKSTILKESLVDCQNAKNSNVVVAKQGEVEQTIKDLNSKYILYKADIFPYMAYVDNTGLLAVDSQKGQIIVPDGSGAIINFDNGKTEMGATAVNQAYYGRDKAFVSQSVLEDTKDLMLGMFGFIYEGDANHVAHALVGAIEKGGNQVSLFAQTKDKISSASFSGVLRAYEEVAIGAYTNKSKFNKWSPILTNSDLEFQYLLLDGTKANYSSMAQAYRDYLVKRDNITKTDTTNETVVDLNFLGAFEKYALFLGFKYKTPDTLTTFNQATDIVNELSTGIEVDGSSRKVNAFSVSYTGWTSEELQYQVGGKLSVSSKLGGKRGMQKFADTLNSKGISFYPEVYITTTQGYDLAYGNLKYTSRSISNAVANVYKFDVATQRQNKKLPHTNMINPAYYSSVTDIMVKNYGKLKLNEANNGSYLVDLGNMTVGSYNKNSGITLGQDAITLQKASLAKMAELGNVKVKAPYDYAFKYVDFATEIPLTSTKLAIYDETIPFYQLVVSGLFDYTTEEINGTSNYGAKWYFAKAIESGANLSFQISATNPTVLLDTDYTYYYQAFYDNWKEEIVTLADKMDTLGIAKGNLVSHKLIDKDISLVAYEMKDGSGLLEFYVNATSKEYTYVDEGMNTIVIPSYGYTLK